MATHPNFQAMEGTSMEYVIGKDQGGKLKKYSTYPKKFHATWGFYVEIKKKHQGAFITSDYIKILRR